MREIRSKDMRVDAETAQRWGTQMEESLKDADRCSCKAEMAALRREVQTLRKLVTRQQPAAKH